MRNTYVRQQQTLSAAILDLLELIDTPRALALAISYRYLKFKDVHKELLEDPCMFSHSRYLLDSQAVALFKKSTYLEKIEDLDAKAVANFHELEDELTILNRGGFSFEARGILYTASRIIRRILGPVPELDDLKVSYTSGATFSRTADLSTLSDKISGFLDVTAHALPYLLKYLGSHPLLFRAYQDKKFKIVRGNKFSTVPKDFRKVRTICKEPLGNMLLQRSFGLYIKDRLKRENIYIETGQSDHIAVLQYFSDAWATIDQSDASDRISRALIKELLDPDWFSILDNIRSKRTIINGREHQLEKFMTQGNGFTFELETLVFYALGQAISIETHKRTPIFVYGDDMIVVKGIACDVVRYLPLFGLKVNTEKTFIRGDFKESCGFDILKGYKVRPFYLKEFDRNETVFYVQLSNYIRRVLKHIFYDDYNHVYSRPWLRVVNCIPVSKRYYGPYSLGDEVINTDSRPQGYKGAFWKNNILYCTTYKRVYRGGCYRKPTGDSSILAYALLGGMSSGTLIRNSRYTLRAARVCPVNWA